MSSSEAERTFSKKWPSVKKIIEFHPHRFRKYGVDLEDVIQTAGLKLWKACLRGVGESIHCGLIALAAAEESLQQRRRDGERLAGRRVGSVHVDTDGQHHDPPAPSTGIRVERIRLTLSDARIDNLVPVDIPRLTLREMGNRIGLSSERARQLAPQLGGVKIGSEWHFPAGGQAEIAAGPRGPGG